MPLISLTLWAKRNGKDPRSCRKKAKDGHFLTAVVIGRDWLIDEVEPWSDCRFKKKRSK